MTDIAKSITLYLHDDNCPYRVLAIDLCSRGFEIWQHHVDAMEVLRDLFNLSTSAEKERNVGPQARLAVLQIASSNTPLFMTTLSLDILHPKSVQRRKSIMQLVAFLIRKVTTTPSSMTTFIQTMVRNRWSCIRICRGSWRLLSSPSIQVHLGIERPYLMQPQKSLD